MSSVKRYRVEFFAESVVRDGAPHPSSAAVARAVENALQFIGLEPKGSKVEGSAEQEIADAVKAQVKSIQEAVFGRSEDAGGEAGADQEVRTPAPGHDGEGGHDV